MDNTRAWKYPLLFALLAFIVICCLCALLVVLSGVGVRLLNAAPKSLYVPPFISTPTRTPLVLRPDELGTPVPVPPDTATLLANTVVPVNDLRDLARRLEGKGDIPLTVPPPAVPFQVGAEQTFWVSNVDTNQSFQITAILRHASDHLYFWIQEGVAYDEADLRDLADAFENRIYPINRAFFGSEWSPGVDGDPHLYVLYTADIGFSIAGYFSSVDEYHPLAHEYSNAHEMFLLNADNVDLGDEYTYGVLAHEFQHMIHWHLDRNEETWLNEGFSELAALLNGYEVGGFDYAYINDPDVQLNTWPNHPFGTIPHYGASFLFLTYFFDRFGEDATRSLAANPANGLASVDAVLAGLGAIDPLTGAPITADDLFLDWTLTSFLQDERVADGRYTYTLNPFTPRPLETESIQSCPSGPITRDVHQYGVDYIRIACQGAYKLIFEGATQASVVPADPHSGSYAFWSNRGDESDMTLTRTFDFRGQEGPLTLSYWTWYDLETDYDYLYLEASLDGDRWQILTTPSGTGEDPTGNSFGWGYNGLSGEGPVWIQEQVDLSQFAGQQVQIRFEYITDAAVNGEGFLLDDVAIPEIGYFTDFEAGDGGWVADGFVRIQNALPQTFRLALVTTAGLPEVEKIILPEGNTVEIPIRVGGDIEEVILVVTATTRATNQTAGYRLRLEP